MRKIFVLLLLLSPVALAQSVCMRTHLLPNCSSCSKAGNRVDLSEVKLEGLSRIAKDHNCKIIAAGPAKPDCELEETTPFSIENVDVKFLTSDGCHLDTYHVTTFVQAVNDDGNVLFTNTQVFRTNREDLKCGNRMGQ